MCTALLLCFSSALTGLTEAQTFQRVIASGDAVPGGAFAIAAFGSPPAYADGTLAFTEFHAVPGGSVTGIYKYANGAFQRVANTTDTFPGTGQLFSGFSRICTDRGNVAFVASGSIGVPSPYGICTDDGGSLRTLLTNSTRVPGTFTTFTAIANINMEYADGFVVFTGGWREGVSARDGVFTVESSSGRLHAIAVENQMLPSGVLMAGASNVDTADGRVAFGAIGAGSPNWGIYVAPADESGPVQTIATTNDVNPLTGTPFSVMSFPRIDEDDVVFYAWSNGTTNAVHRQGDFAALVNPNQPLPGGGTFGSVEDYDFSHERIVFEIETPSPVRTQVGLFQTVAGRTTRVLTPGDVIDGKTVASFVLGEDAVDGDVAALLIRFTDNSEAIYLVDLGGCATYGQGIPGDGNRTPRLFAIGDPVRGTTFRLELRDAWNGTPYAGLAVGQHAANVPALGGTLLVQPDFFAAVPIQGPVAGIPHAWASLPVSLPTDPVLIGLHMYSQGYFEDPFAVQGYSVTNGLECVIE
ncbi:MAG: hypothetical protein H6834_10805 [Planctomycetes bacterium]|nr:hypothetical protein [Planctomycetota bacterium]